MGNLLEKEFFDFIYNRQLIWYKRFVLKQKPPWTDDSILNKFKIINMYRELDKCTKYILEKLKGIKSREILFQNIVFYRFFNRVNLYEELEIEQKNLAKEIKSDELIKRFREIKNSGRPIFNDAYLISSNGKEKEKFLEIIKEISSVDFKELIKEIDNSKNPEESFKIIQKINLVGPFLACEIWTDLTYFNFFKQGWDDNDFVNIGPGAKWGLEIMYGNLSKKGLSEKLNHLYKIQGEFLENEGWKKIAYKEAFSNYPFLSITNIEGALCEFRKYKRLGQGKGKRRYYRHQETFIN